MNKIVAYLTFNGNCREAMRFYQSCLGGELEIQTVEESPQGEKLPNSVKRFVLQAALKKDQTVLMGTDMSDGEVSSGNSISILIECSTSQELEEFYRKLSHKGHRSYPVSKTHWGSLFGGLTDRYGKQWLLLYHSTKTINH